MIYLVISNYTGTLVEADEFNDGTLELLVKKCGNKIWKRETNEFDGEIDEEQWLYVDDSGGSGFVGYIEIDGVHEIKEEDRGRAVEGYGEVIKL